VRRQLHLPYIVGQDDDGTWIAETALTPDIFVSGEGETRESALDDLRHQITRVVAESGAPDQLVVDVDVPEN
jgi:predicted RNase H-like HicB family nuclease